MSAPARGDLLDVSKGEVRYTLGAEHPPVATVAPGTRIRLAAELNIGDVLHSVHERFAASMVNLPFVNPVTGPVAVEGATPASVLVCRIEEMEVLAPGFTALVPGFGPFVTGSGPATSVCTRGSSTSATARSCGTSGRGSRSS